MYHSDNLEVASDLRKQAGVLQQKVTVVENCFFSQLSSALHTTHTLVLEGNAKMPIVFILELLTIFWRGSRILIPDLAAKLENQAVEYIFTSIYLRVYVPCPS